MYRRAGFNVRTILTDGEFKNIQEYTADSRMQYHGGKRAHEQGGTFNQNSQVKDTGLIGMLPFDNIPWRMKIKFVYFILLWLNAFPVKTGVSLIYSPRELLVCRQLDYKKHCRVLPGTYCEVHDEPSPSNMMVP